MDSVGIKIDLNVDKIIAEAKGSYSKYRENKTYNKETYDELLEKYSKAIELAETLRDEIAQLKNSELTKEKVEAMDSAVNLLSNLDITKLDAIMELGKKLGGNT